MLFLIVSCRESKYKKFVGVYNNEKFDEFTNFELLVRDFDRNGDPIVGVIQLTSSVRQVYFVTIQRKSGKVKKTNFDRLLNKSIVDTLKMNYLASRFLKYDVNQLRVDSTGDISVKLINGSRELLVKYGDESRVGKQCEKVRGKWYLCR